METPVFALLPKDVNTSSLLRFSSMGIAEAEEIAVNIVAAARRINPDAWTAFSLEDYRKHSDHPVNYLEENILEMFVKGGKLHWSQSCQLKPGYLAKDANGKYHVTELFIKVLEKFKN